MMPELTRDLLESGFALPDSVECGMLSRSPERIVQFGEGNFLRAFVDWMIDGLNEKGGFNGSVVVVQPIKVGKAHLLNDQQGCYTLTLRGQEGGQVLDRRRVVTSINRALQPYDEWESVIQVFQNPDIRLMVSNTTEAGIVYQEQPYVSGQCPDSFPAKVTQLLYERYNALGRDKAAGLIIVPCELIDRNGDKLCRAVLQHAADWKLPEGFVTWVKEANHFLNTLVDRIVPGYPAEEADRFATELGYDDRLLVTGEPFHLWVIEGPQELAAELPLYQAGYNVVWTNDLTPYRIRKVRILNGAHTCSVLAAYRAGLNTVGEMMDDDDFLPYLRQAIFNEILPTVALPEEEKRSFADAVLERFQNPFMKHELLSISLNSVSKWKVRVLPSLLDFYEQTGKYPAALTFSLAALINFYHGVGTGKGTLRGRRDDEHYEIRDNEEVLGFMEKRWHVFEQSHDLKVLVATVLANDELWGQDLTLLDGLVDCVTNNLQSILFRGVREAVKELIAK